MVRFHDLWDSCRSNSSSTKKEEKKAMHLPPVALTMEELSTALISKMMEHSALKVEYREWIGSAKLSLIPLLKDPAEEPVPEPEDDQEDAIAEKTSEEIDTDPINETVEQAEIALSMYHKAIPRTRTPSVAWVLDKMCTSMSDAIIELAKRKEEALIAKESEKLLEENEIKAPDVDEEAQEKEADTEKKVVEWLVFNETQKDEFKLMSIPVKETKKIKLYPYGDFASIRCEVEGFNAEESEIENRMWGHLLLPRHNCVADIEEEKRQGYGNA
eukprot:TRINITY_DN2708_c0_g1_i1.p1 TRINITY_DN2708_c0_g1~~TRINITY_DN2708_c0_g1_i1.p1  ORF type:complete len:272 (-),score=57.58 TRINITY_DN2708_c0_g1_i1:232-1047(-)